MIIKNAFNSFMLLMRAMFLISILLIKNNSAVCRVN